MKTHDAQMFFSIYQKRLFSTPLRIKDKKKTESLKGPDEQTRQSSEARNRKRLFLFVLEQRLL